MEAVLDPTAPVADLMPTFPVAMPTSRISTKVGDRIILWQMHEDPDPVLRGTTGTVTAVHEYHSSLLKDTIDVNWDNGRTLSLIAGVDYWYRLTSSSRELIVSRLYKSGCTMQEIGDRMGLTRQRIHQLLVSYGVPRRPRGRPRKEAVGLTTPF